MRRATSLLAGNLFVLFAAACGAQTGVQTGAQTGVQDSVSAPAGPNSVGPTEKAASLGSSEAHPTTVDLLVHDRKGRSVTDLKPSDLLITEGGKTVELTSLRAVQGTEAGERLVTFVFGQLSPAAAKHARGVALSLLKTFPDRGYSYSVLGVDGRLRLFARPTRNRSAIQDAIETLTTADPTAWQQAYAAQEKQLIAAADGPVGPDQTSAQSTLDALKQSQRLVLDRHDLPDLAGVTALCMAQQRLPGRKAILYFGQSTQTDVNTLDQFHAAIHAANEAGISIYTVDMNGLDYAASQGMMASLSVSSMGSGAQVHASGSGGPAVGFQATIGPAGLTAMNDTINNIAVDNLEGVSSAFGALAVQTGGRYTSFSEGIKKWSKQLASDLDHSYQASYLPPAENADGSVQAISISALHRDLIIHAPSVSPAQLRKEARTASLLDGSLVAIFAHPDTAGTLAHRAAALHFYGATAGGITELVVEVPIDSLEVREDPNTDLYVYHLRVAARVEKLDGTLLQEFGEEIHHRGRLDALDGDRTGALTFQRHAVLPPGDYKLVTALVDANSGKTGISAKAFAVASSTSGQSGAQLSDLVLVRRTEHAADAPDETDPDPLRYGSTKVVPDLSATPAAGSGTTLFFTAQPGSSAPAPILISLRKDGTEVNHCTVQPVPAGHVAASAGSPAAGGVAYMSTLPVGSLAPGKYELVAGETPGDTKSGHRLALDLGASSDSSIVAAASETLGDATVLSAPLPDAEHSPLGHVLAEWIDVARKRALNYQGKLPNFICLETIDRSTDRAGNGHWTHRDTISELLTYHDRDESRVVLAINGSKPDADHRDFSGPRSNGEYGSLLQAIFEPAVDAKLEWVEEKQIAGTPVQVFRYEVAQSKSSFSLTDSNHKVATVAFRGIVSIEPATGAVRSLSIQAENLPKDFGIRASSISVDYDYVAINHHDYLVPVRGEVTLQEGKHRVQMNRLQFRDYHRFLAQSRILGFEPVSAPQ